MNLAQKDPVRAGRELENEEGARSKSSKNALSISKKYFKKAARERP
jgi:hypothetical protein